MHLRVPIIFLLHQGPCVVCYKIFFALWRKQKMTSSSPRINMIYINEYPIEFLRISCGDQVCQYYDQITFSLKTSQIFPSTYDAFLRMKRILYISRSMSPNPLISSEDETLDKTRIYIYSIKIMLRPLLFTLLPHYKLM